MRIAVYDKYWATAGGGEKYAGGVAEVLSRHHDVTLFAHEPVDLDRLGERLALDLSRVAVAVVGEAGRVEEASAAYDLLVNVSFFSGDRNGAPRGIYIVHFPQDPLAAVGPKHQRLLRTFGPLLGARHLPYRFGPGFHPADVLKIWRFRWTDGDGQLLVTLPPGARTDVRLFVGSMLPPEVSLDAEVAVDDRVVADLSVRAARSRRDVLLPRPVTVPVTGPADGGPVRIHVRSDTWSPDALLGNDDHRRLGVPVTGVAVGRSPRALARAHASVFELWPPHIDFAESYDAVLANSRFTQQWIERYWHQPSDVLYPPVTVRDPLPEEPVILSVGRFFRADRGHSKKQVEMVRAFRALVAELGPTADGWTLHLVGGCADEDLAYVEQVRAEAAGLPVELHVNATGEELDRLYRRASIYWHAAGFGEDPDAHPDRMEHFGITTCEALAAGAVAVAYGVAGPLEAFSHGVEGFHFHTLDELVRHSARLVRDPELRRVMRANAVRRGRAFGMDAFAERLLAAIDAVDATGP